MTELREYYVVKERDTFFGGKMHDPRAKTKCLKVSPICYLALEQFKLKKEAEFTILRSNFILSNLKMEYFPTEHKASRLDASPAEKIISENDLLIERQRHVCEQRDEDLERMKAEVHDRASKQLANYTAKVKTKNPLKASQTYDAKTAYEQYVSKKIQETHESVIDDLSDSSHLQQSQEGEGKPIFDSRMVWHHPVYQSEYNIDRQRTATQTNM